jgi:glycerol-3-phosphate dehydrogenase subunit B
MSADGCEVLVIGEGLSGLIAAATAASQGSRVTLVSKGPGNFVLGPACIDLDGLDAAKFVEDGVESAVRFFLELTASAECTYSGGVRERRLVPTVLGAFQSVTLAPRWLWQADPCNLNKAVVVGISNMPTFDANFVAERLSFYCREAGAPTSYRSEIVTLPDHPSHALTALEVAGHFDRDSAYRAALARALRPAAHDAELLILPAILGVKSSDADLVCFEEDIGCAVCELATLPPSVTGLRLLQRLERRLVNMGVEISTGFPVIRPCTEGDHCVGVELDTPGRPRQLRADTIVLACGRFSQFIDGPPAGYNSAFDNVFTCGSFLGQFEPRHRNAISILSGYQAGMLASRQGVQYAGR